MARCEQANPAAATALPSQSRSATARASGRSIVVAALLIGSEPMPAGQSEAGKVQVEELEDGEEGGRVDVVHRGNARRHLVEAEHLLALGAEAELHHEPLQPKHGRGRPPTLRRPARPDECDGCDGGSDAREDRHQRLALARQAGALAEVVVA